MQFPNDWHLSFFKGPIVYIGFEVSTAVVMKSFIFWDIRPCSPLKRTDVSDKELACCLSNTGFFLRLFDPEDGGDMLIHNVG
jgi:hypothetical protein